MSTVVLDTNVVSFVFKGHSLAQVYRPHLQGNTLAISFMTLAEILEGAYRASWGTAKLSLLEAMFQSYLVVPSSRDVCEHWAQIRTERRQRPISPDDGWIAATARAYGWPLVTHNPKDFAGITRLTVVTEHQAGP